MKLLSSLTQIALLILFVTASVFGQGTDPQLPFVRGVRIYGGDVETSLPMIIRGDRNERGEFITANDFITIVFDVNEISPPRLQIKFRHCNKNWQIDETPIVRDDFYSTTRTLAYETSPPGVRHYTFRFKNQFPGANNPFVRFLYSGNWVFDITKEFDESVVYASGRFFVVDAGVRTMLNIRNDYWTDFPTPLDRVHELITDVKVPDSMYTDYVTTIDVFQNRRLFHPHRVSTWERAYNTRVEGVGMPEKRFTYENIIPGNAYRVYDFRSPGLYPAGLPVNKLGNPDFTRFRFGSDDPHHFGAALLTHGNGWDDDYMQVKFALAFPRDDSISIFLAGAFNNWDPMLEDKLIWDEKENQYIVWKMLLRGSYDYQYVMGEWDMKAGYVVEQDWTTIEGSAWETRNHYWCLVYYDDPAFGGIDRIVGFAEVESGR